MSEGPPYVLEARVRVAPGYRRVFVRGLGCRVLHQAGALGVRWHVTDDGRDSSGEGALPQDLGPAGEMASALVALDLHGWLGTFAVQWRPLCVLVLEPSQVVTDGPG